MTRVGRGRSCVLVLSSLHDLDMEKQTFNLVVPLFWAAPETLTLLEHRSRSQVLSLSELVPEISTVLRETYRIAHDIAASSPTYRDVYPLLGFETNLADSLLPHVIAARVLDELVTRGEAGEIAIRGHGPWADAFADAVARRGTAFHVHIAGGGQATPPSQRTRIVNAALDTIAERDWRRLIAQPAEHFGPRFRRSRRQQLSTGGMWCYASYVNYSRALARHGPPHEAQWLVNGRSGAAGVPAGRRVGHLWDVGRPAPRGAHDLAAREILAHVASQWPLEAHPNLGSLILGTLAEIDLFTTFVHRYAPEGIWVGNQWGGEGTLIQIAHGAGIPVTQVQHGALESHFRWANLASDRFLVWGEAWWRGLPEPSRAVTSIVNPDAPSVQQSTNSRRESQVVFLTAPTDQPLWDPVVARDEAASVLGGVVRRGGRVVARIHPMDATRSWLSSLRAAGANPDRVDKGGRMSRSLHEATAALTYRSTAFMDCIASGIPVIALGWYPWVWDDSVREFDAMTLAASIEEATTACLSTPDSQPDLSPWLARRE